jgi:glycosyltransferase involved in cell wall biosynthesis
MTSEKTKIKRNKNGKPRVLHIGNIANNGYIASLILNQRGVESHLLVMDYYHIGGCPEWESAEIEGNWLNDFYPAWYKVNLHGYKRPDWIAQGPKYMAIQYLVALNQKKFFKKWFLRLSLAFFRNSLASPRWSPWFYRIFYSPFSQKVRARTGFDSAGSPPKPPKAPFPGAEWVQPVKASQILAAIIEPAKKVPLAPTTQVDMNTRIKELTALLRKTSEPRAALEMQTEIAHLKSTLNPTRLVDEVLFADFDAHKWKGLFEYYDVVVGYSTEGIYPLMVGKPYMALEHGTIRKIPFGNDYIGRQTKTVYKKANGVFITNADNNKAAEDLQLENYRYIPHPTMQDNISEQKTKSQVLREKLEKTRDCDFIVFSPARHHWQPEGRDSNWDKGNDLIIKAFAKLVLEHKVRGLLMLVDAGQMVEKSKDLIASLGIGPRVIWMKTQSHRSFIRFIMASDVIADQFGHPLTFGGIPPKAMQCEVPVLTYFDPKIHTWCLAEPPPFLNPGTTESICSTLLMLHDNPAERKRLGVKGREWYEKYYSNDVFFKIFCEMTEKSLGIDLTK